MDIAKLCGIPELGKWIKEQGPHMSFYLYKKGFSIPDFYIQFQIGEDKTSIINSVIQALSDLLKDTEIIKFRINEYDEEIKKFARKIRKKF
ncbi:hypothetical protein [Bartonella raoultii]|uniref:Uncharacterized protein n=1 Tax=Bartonella raoultii TaxID=1457020 RepID=A0ABS7I925_9HYPH|nr:hypothetical protein [Bartonella raoultii]MBX4335932.1 hypothetical protein [Bartonella raoultii]